VLRIGNHASALASSVLAFSPSVRAIGGTNDEEIGAASPTAHFKPSGRHSFMFRARLSRNSFASAAKIEEPLAGVSDVLNLSSSGCADAVADPPEHEAKRARGNEADSQCRISLRSRVGLGDQSAGIGRAIMARYVPRQRKALRPCLRVCRRPIAPPISPAVPHLRPQRHTMQADAATLMD
jgi:hypothetical protein